jgi:nucleoside 2-deoxyribosyltransferase
MKVYFSGSIRGGEPDRVWLQTLIRYISRHGKVLTENSFGYSPEEEASFDDAWIYERDVEWLREADAVVAEVSAPSLGVGYEIAKAEEWGKPLLLLYREQPGRKPSAMLNGNKALEMLVFTEEEDALKAVDSFLSPIKGSGASAAS